MDDAILTVNAGSSSIKFSLFVESDENLSLRLSGQIEGLYTAPHFLARDPDGAIVGEERWADGTRLGHGGGIQHLTAFLRNQRQKYRLAAIGHRVVHGGVHFAQPVKVDAEVAALLERLVPLAPLHQPHNLAPIRAMLERRPDLPQVACFDTAFHRNQPAVAEAFALPPEITARGVRRYGFHGLSYEYIASVMPRYDAQAAAGRVVVAHLGSGASMCAIKGGQSIACTSGFTPLDGLPMGTRCGALDPGVVLYLMDELKMDARGIEKLLYQRSGLLGVSGIASDMRSLIRSNDPRAAAAIDLFVYRIGRELGSLAAALQGLDALVFTAGIGEHSALVRERVCRAAAWLGVELDERTNEAGGPRLSISGSRVSVWVIPTNEELMIALHTKRLIARKVS
jgi:acetate kinase